GIHPTPVYEVGIGDRGVGEIVHLLKERDELFRMMEGQRIDQHTIHNRENRRISSDSEREREDGDDGKAGRLGQHAEGVTEILEHKGLDLRSFYRLARRSGHREIGENLTADERRSKSPASPTSCVIGKTNPILTTETRRHGEITVVEKPQNLTADERC